MHFLHTGDYQTLRSHDLSLTQRHIKEHKRAISIYVVAGKYGLKELQALAITKISYIESELSTEDILKHIKAAFSKISEDDEWLASYLEDTIKKTFVFAGASDAAPF